MLVLMSAKKILVKLFSQYFGGLLLNKKRETINCSNIN